MTGDHLSFEGNYGVRARPSRAAGGGRSNGVEPSLSSDFSLIYLLLPPGAGAHATSWPRHVRRNGTASGEALNVLGPTS